MKIDIETRDFTLTDALRGYVERRLYLTLARFTHRIERITLVLEAVLEEVNGSREGLAYQCQLRVERTHQPELVIEDGGAYLYVAIDRAADRAGRRLARAIEGDKEQAPLSNVIALAPRFREWIARRGTA